MSKRCPCDLCKRVRAGGKFSPEEVNKYLDDNNIKTERYEVDKYVSQKIQVGSHRRDEY